jgi:hypothetical protein
MIMSCARTAMQRASKSSQASSKLHHYKLIVHPNGTSTLIVYF